MHERDIWASYVERKMFKPTAVNADTIITSICIKIFELVAKLSHCYVFLELHDAVFVVGALDETIMLRGMRYHPIDVENSILRCHKKISEWWVLEFYIWMYLITNYSE